LLLDIVKVVVDLLGGILWKEMFLFSQLQFF